MNIHSNEEDVDTLDVLAQIPPMGVEAVIPDPKAEARLHYVANYGRRITDGALVFHLFPPLTDAGSIGEWGEDSTITQRLERAIPATFDVDRVTAGYEETMDSFYVICGGYGDVPDMRLLIKRFLDAIDVDAS